MGFRTYDSADAKKDRQFWSSDEQRHKWEAWYAAHGRSFEECFGTTHHPEVFLPLIARFTRYMFASFPMWKDDVDRARCDVLRAYLEGEDIPHEELATAIGLLMQAFSSACDRIGMFEAHQLREQMKPRYPRPTVPQRG